MKGLFVFAFFLYFPYGWCAFSGKPREEFGLIWAADGKSLRDIAALSFLTLIPLTALSVLLFGSRLFPQSPESVLAAVLSGLAAAAAEETFFRGWVQTLLGYRFSRSWSIILASAVFGLAHLASPHAPFAVLAFFPGLVMGYLRDRHGSVFPAILYHWIGNIWSIWYYPRF